MLRRDPHHAELPARSRAHGHQATRMPQHDRGLVGRDRAAEDAVAAARVGRPFASFHLPEPVMAGIQAAGFTHCTPIQEKVLPLALAGRDVAGQAQTGTGKTAAFLITIFTRLLARERPGRPAAPRALVIAPTRELVVQIANDARLLGQAAPFGIQAVYGGIDYHKQRSELRAGVDVLMGTPGRLTAEKVEHLVYHVAKHEKLRLLVGLLRRETIDLRALVFVNMRRAAERLVRYLEANRFNAAAITGDVDQRRRLRIMADFKEGRLPILVATDVASRGLHIEGVTHVFNYDLPFDAEDYVHRVGRTARAGASGRAVSLACEEDVDGLEAIERFIGFKLPWEIPEDAMLAHPLHHPPREHGEHRRPHGRPHHPAPPPTGGDRTRRKRRRRGQGSGAPRPAQ